jgi:hypothetical protein
LNEINDWLIASMHFVTNVPVQHRNTGYPWLLAHPITVQVQQSVQSKQTVQSEQTVQTVQTVQSEQTVQSIQSEQTVQLYKRIELSPSSI